MAQKRLDQLCRSVLPPGYAQVKRQLPELQAFLEQNLPETVNRQVTLLTLNSDEIVIAASTPMVANYLRLHAAEIGQQLRETFGLEQRLRFRSLPDDLLSVGRENPPRAPRAVSAASVAAIRSSANWVEDEELKAALLSLAQSLEKN